MSRASKLAGLVDKSPIRREGTPAIPPAPSIRAGKAGRPAGTPGRNERPAYPVVQPTACRSSARHLRGRVARRFAHNQPESGQYSPGVAHSRDAGQQLEKLASGQVSGQASGHSIGELLRHNAYRMATHNHPTQSIAKTFPRRSNGNEESLNRSIQGDFFYANPNRQFPHRLSSRRG